MKGKFDFILEDAIFEVRQKTYKDIVALINPNGTLILDDGHYITHRRITKNIINTYKFVEYDIKDLTIDEFGRYGMLMSKNKELWK